MQNGAIVLPHQRFYENRELAEAPTQKWSRLCDSLTTPVRTKFQGPQSAPLVTPSPRVMVRKA